MGANELYLVNVGIGLLFSIGIYYWVFSEEKRKLRKPKN